MLVEWLKVVEKISVKKNLSFSIGSEEKTSKTLTKKVIENSKLIDEKPLKPSRMTEEENQKGSHF